MIHHDIMSKNQCKILNSKREISFCELETPVIGHWGRGVHL